MMNSRPTKRPEGRRGPFKGLRKGIARIVSSRAFLRVASLLAAVVIWCILVTSDGSLTMQRIFQNVAVSVTGEATLKSRGYIVMDDLSELLPAVKMTVEVTQANYNRVSGTAYNPHLDLTQVTGEGANTLDVLFSSQLYGPVTACEPASVTVNVERYMTRRIPVIVEQTGSVPQGVYLDSVKTDPTMLSVSGPQSLVSSVARAVAKLDLSTLTLARASDRAALDIELQDASGEAIVSDKLEITNQTVITNTIVAETEVLPMRSIPLDIEGFVTGEPAEGYELIGIVTREDAVDIAASSEILEALTVLTTDQPLNIDGATESLSGYVKLKRPTGIENTVPTDVGVTAQIAERIIERTFRKVAIEMEGRNPETSVYLSGVSMTVQLTGGYNFLHSLTNDDIRLYVDLSGLEPGSYTLPVQIHIEDAQDFTCALSSPEIAVTIKSK